MLDQADQLPHGDLSPGHGGPRGGGEVGAGGVSLAPGGTLAPLQTENNNWLMELMHKASMISPR